MKSLSQKKSCVRTEFVLRAHKLLLVWVVHRRAQQKLWPFFKFFSTLRPSFLCPRLLSAFSASTVDHGRRPLPAISVALLLHIPRERRRRHINKYCPFPAAATIVAFIPGDPGATTTSLSFLYCAGILFFSAIAYHASFCSVRNCQWRFPHSPFRFVYTQFSYNHI